MAPTAPNMAGSDTARTASDMESSEVYWTLVYYALVTLAVNAMVQITGRVCGLDRTLRVYLRSSPLVCASDLIAIFLRFAAYSVWGMWSADAAKRIVALRHDDISEATQSPNTSKPIEQRSAPRWFAFMASVLPQIIKLFACTGLPYSQAWGGMYFVYFAVTEILGWVAASSSRRMQEITPDDKMFKQLEGWMRFCEHGLVIAAVLVQLGVLGWVDLMLTPNEGQPLQKWEYVVLRISAHVLAGVVDIVVVMYTSDKPNLAKALGRRVLVASMFVVFTILLVFHQIDAHFTLMYFLLSFGISSITWVLFLNQWTRKKVLMCEAGGQWDLNVLAFDFFCRMLIFSSYWYVGHYDSSGTSKPRWVEYLG